MPVIDSQQILRLVAQGETEVSIEQPFLVDRISLELVAGQKSYVLPDYVLSIRRITYLGIGLDPLPRSNQREVFQNSTQQGTPFWYVFDNVGLNNVQLFPCPQFNVAALADGTDLFLQSSISAGLIIEFDRVADGQNFIIPPTLRRQLLKKYVAANAFLVDNQNVNIKLSRYFTQRWMRSKVEFFELMNVLYNQPRRLVINDFQTYNWIPGVPILPINKFGISVETGE